MILPTMTLTELAKEIQSDYKEVHARWTKFNPKFNKMRLKQTYYPWIWNTEIITKKNNKWFFSFYAQSKEDANVVIPHAYYAINYIDMVGQYASVNGFHLWLQDLLI